MICLRQMVCSLLHIYVVYSVPRVKNMRISPKSHDRRITVLLVHGFFVPR